MPSLPSINTRLRVPRRNSLEILSPSDNIAADIAGMEGEPKVVEPRKRFSFRDIIESRWASVFPRLELNTGVKLKYLMAF